MRYSDLKRAGLPLVLSATLAMAALTGCAAATENPSTSSTDEVKTESVATAEAAATSVESESTAENDAAVQNEAANHNDSADKGKVAAAEETTAQSEAADAQESNAGDAKASTVVTSVTSYEGGVLDTSDMFTDRDLTQTADLENAQYISVTSGDTVEITEEGVYVLSGTATEATIVVNADDTAKVQLVLDGLSVTNTSEAVIFVASADKVFVTTAEGSTNELTVSDAFASSLDDNVDGVVFSKDDIVFNGLGTLSITSADNGIVGKDDVKITGGTYSITVNGHAIEGKDSVCIADGSFTLSSATDGIHAENSDDDSKGSVYICGGTFDIKAESDGIEGDAVVQIDGGTFDIVAEEAIEGTYVQINGGTIDIQASDDGINASIKSTSYAATLEINGGDISVVMAQGDTDALDSNGNLIINGGTVDISAQFAFDFEGQAQLNGGTVYVNGEQVSEITESMMMGGMGMGEMPGAPGEMGGAPDGSMPSGPGGRF